MVFGKPICGNRMVRCIEKEKKKIEVDCMICVLFVENNNNRHKAIEYERQVMNKKTYS